MWNFSLTPATLQGRQTITTLILLITFLSACTGASQPQAPTHTPLPPPTNTAIPTNTPLPTETPVPTDTPLPTDTPTLEPTATQDLTATAAVEATQAVEKAMESIGKELEKYGVSTKEGKLGWVSSESVTLKVNMYRDSDAQAIDPDLVVGDFVFQTEVTWESTGGLAACGLLFRAEEDLERGAQYMFYTVRFSGLPIWVVYRVEFNTVQDDMTAKYPFSSSINQKQGSTNTYTLLAKGNSFTFYANGDRLGTVFNSKIPEGRVAYFVSQESGETTCTFANSWLWILNQE